MKNTAIWIIVGIIAIVAVLEIADYYHGENTHSMNEYTMMNHSSTVTSEETFIVNMIPHHQEAVDTARLVVEKGENPELKILAKNIISAQQAEIALMNIWLGNYDLTNITSSYMPMMREGDTLVGSDLDRWFLHGMIMHHMGAVQMAESLLKLDARKEVSDFAREVIRAQSAEISQMKRMLGENMMELHS